MFDIIQNGIRCVGLPFFALSSVLVAGLSTAKASVPASAQVDKVSPDSSDGELDELAATGYRFDFEPLDTPVNSTFVGSKKIEQSPYSNVAEAIKNFGNINFRSVSGSSASGDFGMRGFGENSQTRVLVIIDGQKFNRADMGSINWLQIPLSDVESIEILRGSQTALYGSSAEAGVIRINTLRPKEDGLSFASQASIGSYKTYNASARASGRDGDCFFSTGVNLFDSQGWRENSQSRASGGDISLGTDIDENNTFVFAGNYADSHTMYPGALTWSQFEKNPRQSTGVGASYSRDGLYTATFQNKSASGEGEVGLGWNFRDIDWNLGKRSRNFQWTGTLTPRYKFDVGDAAHVLVGFDGTCDSIDYTGYYTYNDLDKTYEDANAKLSGESFAPYIGGDWSPIEGLTFSTVGRFDESHLDAKNTEYLDSTLSPTKVVIYKGKKYVVSNPDYPAKINPLNTYDCAMWRNGIGANFAANWRVRDDTSLFFKFDRIFHCPTTDEIAAYQGAILPVMFNFNLVPETGENYEAGVKYSDGGLTFTGSVYLTNLDNEIAYSYYTDSTGSEYMMNTNLPPTVRYGVDFECAYDTKFWGVGAMLSAVRAEFESGKFSGNSIPLVPEFTGNITAYVRPLEWITIGTRLCFVTSQFVGSDFSNSSVSKIPSYALLDFNAYFAVCRYGGFFLSIENALDKSYVSCAWKSVCYPSGGRMLKAGFNIKF